MCDAKGGDQNGVTGPRDPSEVSTHESSRVLHPEREPSFSLFDTAKVWEAIVP
jgi:hypothetical protein